MDGSRFDGVTRALVASRRGALKILLGGAAVGFLAPVGEAEGTALRKPPGFERLGKRCGPGRGQGRRCGRFVPCTNGFCRPIKCFIGGAVVGDRVTNPANPCERCLALEANGAWRRWSAVRNGQTCPPDGSGNPCLSTFIATCRDGVCVPDHLPDGADCGAGETCCAGVCGPDTDCCAPADRRRGRAAGECASVCAIGGTDYGLGEFNPEDFCLWCDPRVDGAGWSPVPPNRACDAAGLLVCCGGVCCPQGTICRSNDDGSVFCGP